MEPLKCSAWARFEMSAALLRLATVILRNEGSVRLRRTPAVHPPGHNDGRARGSSANGSRRQILPGVRMTESRRSSIFHPVMTVKITDTTMRDGHQSLLATRMRTAPRHSERRPHSCPHSLSSRRNPGRGQRISSLHAPLQPMTPLISLLPSSSFLLPSPS
jgi:hypothetical protein